MSAHRSSTPTAGGQPKVSGARKSGLTRLQLCLMGKGFVQTFKPMSRAQADAWADRAKPAGR